MSERQYVVTGMHCAGCASRVENRVGRVPGVTSAKVNLVARILRVSFRAEADDGAVISAVTQAGFQCQVNEAVADQPIPVDERGLQFRRLLISAGLWAGVFVLMLGKMMFPSAAGNWLGIVQLALTLGVFYVNRPVFFNGFRRLLDGADMDSLVALGCTASLGLSIYTLFKGGHFYFESAAMILVVVTFGRYLEGGARKKAGEALDKLKQLAPSTVSCLVGGTECQLPLEQVKKGMLVLVRPGSRIPCDGIVEWGSSATDESTLTGESLPKDVSENSQVYAGTMNLSGALYIRVTGVGQETLLSGVIRLVSQATLDNSPAVRLADYLAARFVPIVLGIAVVTLVGWLLAGAGVSRALTYAISVLVVSCPCALGLATPVAVTIAMGRGAAMGVLFKNGAALETLGKIQKLFIDKTGTVTTGQLSVSRVMPADGIQTVELLSLCASVEQNSGHPLARAVVAYAKEQGCTLKQVEQFQEVPGRGVQALLDGQPLCVGNSLFAKISQAENTQNGETVLYVTRAGQFIGEVGLKDTLNEHSREAVQMLKEQKVVVQILTGDQAECAAQIAQECGISEYTAGLMPADKAELIQLARKAGLCCAMAGDGINDAPALATADVGIAVGSGADIAMDCADMVLLTRDLRQLARAVQLSRRTMNNVRQNLCWAFGYNLLLMPLAAGVLAPVCGFSLNPMLAAAAMSLSSLCVVGNALRLRRER